MSGRDQKSVRELSDLVGTLENARSRPQDVQIVRDPVLSDRYFTDIDGQCWRKNEGEYVVGVAEYEKIVSTPTELYLLVALVLD